MREVAEGVKAAPSDHELERTIESVPGVASASVERRGDGRSRLRLRLHPDQDAETVAWAVAATLRERFAIALDPAAIRPVTTAASGSTGEEPPRGQRPAGAAVPGAPADAARLADADAEADDADAEADDGGEVAGDVDAADSTPDASGEAEPLEPSSGQAAGDGTSDQVLAVEDRSEHGESDPVRVIRTPSQPGDDRSVEEASTAASRAAIRDLEVHRSDTDVRVTARLEHNGRHGEGTRRQVLTSPGIGRAIAEATVDALRMLVDSPLLVGIDHVSVRHAAEPPTATVVLTLLADRSEDTLIGAALLGSDPDGAVMRATLDALNRRVEPFLATAGPPTS